MSFNAGVGALVAGERFVDMVDQPKDVTRRCVKPRGLFVSMIGGIGHVRRPRERDQFLVSLQRDEDEQAARVTLPNLATHRQRADNISHRGRPPQNDRSFPVHDALENQPERKNQIVQSASKPSSKGPESSTKRFEKNRKHPFLEVRHGLL